jgi:hypothetical protein
MTAPAGAPVPGDPGHRHRPGTVVAAAVVLGATLAVLGVVQWAGQPRAGPSGGSFTVVEQAFRSAGLQVCARDDHPSGLAPGAVESRTYEIAVGCGERQAPVIVDLFSSTGARDNAARQFESLTRPRGSGVVYTLGATTVFLPGSGNGAVLGRLTAALSATGAR